MSLADKLTKLNTDIANAYNSISAKGGTIPTNKNTENLSNAIESIEGGGGGIGLVAIYVETAGKTKYNVGEIFSLNEYVIKAVYTDEAQKEVTSSCTFTPSGELTAQDTTITISYTEDGITKTVTQEITVTEYEQIINYTMLYDNGDECTDITGGWGPTAIPSASSYTKVECTKNEDSISANVTTSSTNRQALFNTLNSIDVTNYKKALAKYSIISKITWGELGMYNTITSTTSVTKNATLSLSGGSVAENGAVGDYLKIADITSTGKFFVKGYVNRGSSSDGNPHLKMYAYALLKQDDWQSLSSLAGITATSINDMLTNSTTLLSNEEAVNFMIYNCTGDFMASAIQSETFLTALNNSPYKTIIMANEHWAKFLNMVV